MKPTIFKSAIVIVNTVKGLYSAPPQSASFPQDDELCERLFSHEHVWLLMKTIYFVNINDMIGRKNTNPPIGVG
jgi:hypothetical protein